MSDRNLRAHLRRARQHILNKLADTIKAESDVADRIEINPRVMQGKPVIRGTRVPVELLLRKLSEGATIEDLLDVYPRLSAGDIRAALTYAADTIAHETVLAPGPQ